VVLAPAAIGAHDPFLTGCGASTPLDCRPLVPLPLALAPRPPLGCVITGWDRRWQPTVWRSAPVGNPETWALGLRAWLRLRGHYAEELELASLGLR